MNEDIGDKYKVQKKHVVKIYDNGFFTLMKCLRVWDRIKSFCSSFELLNMLKIPTLRYYLLKDPEIFDYILSIINNPVEIPKVPIKEPRNYTAEQKDINLLIEKYVSSDYTIGKQVDARLKTAIKTLLSLQRSKENQNMPQNKFNSAAELILEIFPFDKTIELLTKSTQMFSKNSNSMGEWITFMQNSLAGLLYEGSGLYIESLVNSIQELFKLKDILVDKLRRAKEQIKLFEKENISYKQDLKRYKDCKEYLVARLHDYDLKMIQMSKGAAKLKQDIQTANQKRSSLELDFQNFQKAEENNKKILISEIHSLKSKCNAYTSQKSELIEAFEDLSYTFKSFNLKL